MCSRAHYRIFNYHRCKGETTINVGNTLPLKVKVKGHLKSGCLHDATCPCCDAEVIGIVRLF